MSELDITSSQIEGKGTVTVLHLSGHLHGNTESQLLNRARETHEEGTKYLLLDLSELEVLSSAGLRAIQNIFKLFTPQSDLEIISLHGEEPYKSPYLKLVCPNPQHYYVLNITGFLQSLLIFNNLEDATKSFIG